MQCSAARDWLLMADDVGQPTPDVASHLTGCMACQKLVSDLTGIEIAVRRSPTPPRAISARDAFLVRIAPMPSRKDRIRTTLAVCGVIAATLALAVCLVVLVPPRPQTEQPEPALAQNNPAVVEDLIDWNLRLTEADAPADRQQLVRDQLPVFQASVRTTNLSKEDREFAERLLTEGRRLGETTDPLDEAEMFHGLADTLLVRLDTLASDPDRSEFYARLYSKVADRGVDENLDRAEKTSLKAEKLIRVQNLTKARNKREAKAAALAERMTGKAREHVKPKKAKAKGAVGPR